MKRGEGPVKTVDSVGAELVKAVRDGSPDGALAQVRNLRGHEGEIADRVIEGELAGRMHELRCPVQRREVQLSLADCVGQLLDSSECILLDPRLSRPNTPSILNHIRHVDGEPNADWSNVFPRLLKTLADMKQVPVVYDKLELDKWVHLPWRRPRRRRADWVIFTKNVAVLAIKVSNKTMKEYHGPPGTLILDRREVSFESALAVADEAELVRVAMGTCEDENVGKFLHEMVKPSGTTRTRYEPKQGTHTAFDQRLGLCLSRKRPEESVRDFAYCAENKIYRRATRLVKGGTAEVVDCLFQGKPYPLAELPDRPDGYGALGEFCDRFEPLIGGKIARRSGDQVLLNIQAKARVVRRELVYVVRTGGKVREILDLLADAEILLNPSIVANSVESTVQSVVALAKELWFVRIKEGGLMVSRTAGQRSLEGASTG